MTVQVAFRFDDGRLMSRVIAWWQASDLSHCEVVLGHLRDGQHRCASSSWLDGGMRTKVMALPAEKWRVYEVDRDPIVAHQWAAANNGTPYDWLGLIGYVIRPIRGFNGRTVCSEACAAMLGLHQPWRFTVADLEGFCIATGRRIQ